ncbi:calcium-binding protein [Streptomyces sp. NBC_00249]|uniref:calcium-binding protein n=1 Tax=Streptomyces sp. NBC_00249 TaxID=2975690 RepID=UPI0022507010|nr:calcium-binding protein [Streptomyces sp. NBC_00249]MCX5192809.1 calcium-binding protein [Streptomyces sp. NBC_00249]
MPLSSPRRRAWRTGAVTAAGLALVLGLPGVATAAPGDLDPAFSGDGKVVTNVTGFENIAGMVVQPDGKIVTVGDGYFDETSGDFVLVRYNTDGSLDTTFGGDGIVNTDFDINNDEARALTLQPDGKIVAVGGSTNWGGYGTWASARYNTDGTLDTSYGDGGKALTDIDVDAIETALAVVVQPNGALVLGGSSFGRWTVARLTSTGALDPSFDGDGFVITDFGSAGCCGVNDLALQSDGRIVAAGTSSGFALARYNTDGSLDATFDGDGKVTTGFGNYARGVALQPDGRIVAAGVAGNQFALARFTANGAFDPTFDGDGRVTTNFGPENGGAADVALQSDGRIVAAGSYATDFALARYNTNGSPDLGFDGDGRLTTDFGGVDDQATSVALQTDGKILAAGLAGEAISFSADRAVARYLGGGGIEPPPPTTVDLSVTKTGTTTVSIGDQATYTVTVKNTSTTTAATGVTLTDTLTGPASSLLSATPAQGTCTLTATSANCALGSLAPGAQTTVTLVAEPRATGTLTDRATAAATQTDPATANNTATWTTTVNNARGCTIIGTSGADTLNGGYFNDVICALSGNDTVRASYGNDTVHAGPGNDNVDGGFGDDTLNGQAGNDILTGSYGNDRLTTTDGVSGNDTANGGMGTDTCTTDPGDTRLSCP